MKVGNTLQFSEWTKSLDYEMAYSNAVNCHNNTISGNKQPSDQSYSNEKDRREKEKKKHPTKPLFIPFSRF